MPAVTRSVPERTEKDVQPRVEKCHGLTNVPHPNTGPMDGEDNTRPMEASASPAACPRLVSAGKEGRRHPSFQRWIHAGGNHHSMVSFKGWQVKCLQVWE